MSSTLLVEKRPSEARERLLSTASELFYREGIHSVGVDRVVLTAAVTRGTFYRHFPSKEDLVEAYLAREDSTIRQMFSEAFALETGPDELLELLIQGVADDVTFTHTRGCPFINASAEYPDPSSPVRVAIRSHRAWFRSTLAMALEAAGRPDPEKGASALVLLRDAALVGGYLDGPDEMRDTFVATARAVAGLS
ncbi:TetR/AcrR family transcriptional regulator [Conyzicola nivalis]|uniref:TetR family transcriptional regulator n=1 Tax=Conyzicola nivalis TaxID=1477021 RepID=A0A916WIK9_9MICO|nr:TetR/AcrR family transcriptional regulator [Conyzicola nivalis]GGB01396.1 TetR family transcriptional regulator [Conyzicola nivalis]